MGCVFVLGSLGGYMTHGHAILTTCDVLKFQLVPQCEKTVGKGVFHNQHLLLSLCASFSFLIWIPGTTSVITNPFSIDRLAMIIAECYDETKTVFCDSMGEPQM